MSQIQKMYSLRDSKAESFGNPFYALNDTVASRMVLIAARDPNSLLNCDPKSFDLYCLGSFDDSTGQIETQPPEHIIPVGLIIEADNRKHMEEMKAANNSGDNDA